MLWDHTNTSEQIFLVGFCSPSQQTKHMMAKLLLRGEQEADDGLVFFLALGQSSWVSGFSGFFLTGDAAGGAALHCISLRRCFYLSFTSCMYVLDLQQDEELAFVFLAGCERLLVNSLLNSGCVLLVAQIQALLELFVEGH